MNPSRISIVFISVFSCFQLLNSQVIYPETPIKKVEDTYHNIKVVDDYQWLEQLQDPAVIDWVNQQNKVSERYLKKIEKSNNAINSMKRFMFHEMDYDYEFKDILNNSKLYFKLFYRGKNTEPSIYYKKGIISDYVNLINPGSISHKDQIIFTDLTPSKDGRFLAYQYNRNGSDWKEIKIVQVKNRHYFKETLMHTISSEIYWFGQGFFYKKYNYTSKQGKRELPKIMYHKLATEQSEDKIIAEVAQDSLELNMYGTANQKLYIVKKSNKFTNKFSYSFIDSKSENFELKPLFENIKYDISILKYKSDTVFALTTIKKKKYLISFPISHPKKWKIISPLYKNSVLTNLIILDDKAVIAYQSEKSSLLSIVNFNAELLGEVTIPEGLSVSSLFYSAEQDDIYFKVSSFTIPPVTCKLNIDDYSFEYLGKVEVAFNSSNYKFIKKKITSKDGTQVPMMIVFKDSIKRDGSTPFLLKTYGGYGSIAKASYDPGFIYFIENGGAFAYVHVRGGGEFGFNWREQGKRMHKRNAIADFSYAAEYLVKSGLTSPRKIASIGGSHGGLIVAAAAIEKPELFGATVVDVGVLDMLRFEKSAVGSSYTNINEFGTVTKEDDFKNLKSYSPYHTIKKGVNYPSFLVVTGSDDTRVPPYHSYKFAAKLQSNNAQINPILLWSQNETGHYGANEYNSKIKEKSFLFAFLLEELKRK